MLPPLPRGYVPTKDYAATALLDEPDMVEGMSRAGVPIMELRLSGRVHRFVAKRQADRWLLANIKPMARKGGGS